MAKKVYEESNIAAIASKIREKTGGTKTYKTSEMPGGVEEVYEGGYVQGQSEGYEQGYESGETEGYNKGQTEGYNNGYADAKLESAGGEKAIQIINGRVTEITPEDIDNLKLTQIKNYLLANCGGLRSFVSTKEQNVGATTSSFENSSALQEVRISSLLAGASSIFKDCKSLEKVVFYKGFNVTGYGVFQRCSALKIIDWKGANGVPNLGANTFINAEPTDCKIIVPDNLYDQWIVATNWVALLDRGFSFVKASEYTEDEVTT